MAPRCWRSAWTGRCGGSASGPGRRSPPGGSPGPCSPGCSTPPTRCWPAWCRPGHAVGAARRVRVRPRAHRPAPLPHLPGAGAGAGGHRRVGGRPCGGRAGPAPAAPIAAAVLALVLWTVPLALAAPATGAWRWALPLLAAAAGLLLSPTPAATWSAGALGVRRRPRRVRGKRNPLTRRRRAGRLRDRGRLAGGGPPAGLRPAALVRAARLGGTTLTTNPIVGIQQRLVAADTGPVLRVTTPRPIYVRTTSLDVYDGDDEVWTSQGIRGGDPVGGPVPLPEPLTFEQIQVAGGRGGVDLPGGLLVPLPYQTARRDRQHRRPAALRRPGVSTAFVDADATMQPGDRAVAEAVLPAPSARGAGGRRCPAAGPGDGRAARDARRGRRVRPPSWCRARRPRAWSRRWRSRMSCSRGPTRWTWCRTTAAARWRAFLETRHRLLRAVRRDHGGDAARAGHPGAGRRRLHPGTPVAGGWSAPARPHLHGVPGQRPPGSRCSSPGWLAFEPTPRSDGNVLVPSAANLTPAATVEQERTARPVGGARSRQPGGRPPVGPGTGSRRPRWPRPRAGSRVVTVRALWAAAGVAASVATVLAGGRWSAPARPHRPTARRAGSAGARLARPRRLAARRACRAPAARGGQRPGPTGSTWRAWSGRARTVRPGARVTPPRAARGRRERWARTLHWRTRFCPGRRGRRGRARPCAPA